jgi:hypothetical protein
VTRREKGSSGSSFDARLREIERATLPVRDLEVALRRAGFKLATSAIGEHVRRARKARRVDRPALAVVPLASSARPAASQRHAYRGDPPRRVRIVAELTPESVAALRVGEAWYEPPCEYVPPPVPRPEAPPAALVDAIVGCDARAAAAVRVAGSVVGSVTLDTQGLRPPHPAAVVMAMHDPRELARAIWEATGQDGMSAAEQLTEGLTVLLAAGAVLHTIIACAHPREEIPELPKPFETALQPSSFQA